MTCFRRAVLPLLTALVALPVQARTYCIDPAHGSDEAAGSTQAPWQSLAPLNKQSLSAGDKVLLNPGRIVGSLAPRMKGSAQKPVQIIFAPGTYEWQAEGLNEEKMHISNTNDAPDMPKRVMLDLHAAHHVSVSGKGALLRCRGRMMQLHMDSCSHIAFNGIAFDYARPTVSEYTAVEVGEDSAVFTIHPDSDYRIDNGHLRWVGEGWEEEPGGFVQQYTAEPLHVFNCGNAKGLTGRVEELAPHRVRLYYKNGKNPGFVKGATYQHRQVRREYASVFCNNSSDISYNGVAFHFMHGMGVVSQFSRDLSFTDVSIAPRPESGRTCASWADMLHFSGCSGTIRVKRVFFSGAHDDAINIHGTHLLITDMQGGNRLTLRFKHGQTWGFPAFRAGDEVDFICGKTLNSKGMGKIKEAKLSPDGRSMEVWLEKSIPAGIAPGTDCLENVTATPEVHISQCKVQCIPTRAFLLTTRRPVTVSKNTFIGTHHSALLVADDARSWYESGMVKKMNISGNTFEQCNEPVISISPANREHAKPVHTGISITDNTFNMKGKEGVKLKSAGNVTIKGNRFSAGRAADCVQQSNCSNVQISD